MTSVHASWPRRLPSWSCSASRSEVRRLAAPPAPKIEPMNATTATTRRPSPFSWSMAFFSLGVDAVGGRPARRRSPGEIPRRREFSVSSSLICSVTEAPPPGVGACTRPARTRRCSARPRWRRARWLRPTQQQQQVVSRGRQPAPNATSSRASSVDVRHAVRVVDQIQARRPVISSRAGAIGWKSPGRTGRDALRHGGVSPAYSGRLSREFPVNGTPP